MDVRYYLYLKIILSKQNIYTQLYLHPNMKKEDIFESVRKKMNILEPKFKKQISQVIDHLSHSIEMLYTVATTDEKTGVYNNKFFTTIFDIELEKAKRGSKLSLVIIDIDFFKKFNDTYGHLLGDEILKHLASNLQDQLRKYDILARFGGEEFFVLLPNTRISKAIKVAERLRKGLVKNSKLKRYKVTISLGVTEFKDKDTKVRMIKRADKALYISKKEGRNRVSKL
jgi:diguanylate cyclase (GGDEF)-like protein